MKLTGLADAEGWETLSREKHFANSHVDLVTEEVRTPARAQPRKWTIAHRKAAVVIAPMTGGGELILIQQERIPIRQKIWELPAGQIDDDAEPTTAEIEAVALREMREETGYELRGDGELISLGHYFSSPGFTDECGHLFLARFVQKSASGSAHDESESILDCRSFSPQELARMIAENEIRDANTLSICARLVARGFLSLKLH
ncbi:MAG: ADP-ribose pyrophosphatase [Verrucomicrobiota bacterium]